MLYAYIFVTTLVLCWVLWLTRASGDYNETKAGRLQRGWRRLVFWVGDIYRISHFPWIAWHRTEHLVSIDEAAAALPKIIKGDIGIHRDRGFASNLAIPGFMKHAWIHIDEMRWGETHHMQCVEALSEGVVRHHALNPLHSDYVIILRPKDTKVEERIHACEKARGIVGTQYDADFVFDIEKEIQYFGNIAGSKSGDDDLQEIERIEKNLSAEWDGGFSCTEVVAYAWWHCRTALRLFRTRTRGKDVILADQFLNNSFDIVWCSKSVTPEVAQKHGLHEEGVEMIKAYWFQNTR